jgi:poly-gamma-glutamate synthesis protein (capsule biosynthesis protein)
MRLSLILTLATFLLYLSIFPCPAFCKEIVIAAVGDIMLAGTASPLFKQHGASYPFQLTKSILKTSHIAVGNLEAPITSRGTEFTGKRFRFRSSTETANALKDAGFSILTLANNHILDFGPEGLQDTLENLRRNSILHSGAGVNIDAARLPAIIEAEGKKVAFLSYSLTYPSEFFAGKSGYGTAPGVSSYFRNDIKLAGKQADYVVVSFHWGKELAEKPSNYQIRAARTAIDAGADVVLGHHPHVLQGIERYKNGVIFYSLGNFAFGSRSRHSDRSIIALISLNDGFKNVEIVPLNVLNRDVHYQPSPLRGAAGQEVIARLSRISEGMGTRFISEAGRFLVK